MFNFKILFFLLILIPFSSGAVKIIDTTSTTVNSQNTQGVDILDTREIFNNNTAFVNASQNWNTNSLGPLDDANTTQFESNGGTLSIIESWITSKWCKLTGCTMSGPINMNNNNINNIGNATINNRLFFEDSNHWISKGAVGFNGLSTDAIAIQHKEGHAGGTIGFIVTGNKTNSVNDIVMIMAQVGLNNSAGYLGNSWMISPNNLTANLTDLSNCFFVINATGHIPRISCDTSDTGADFFVQDDIQSGGTMFADGGIRAETLVDFIMNGEDVSIQNGSLHILTPVIFETGVTEGNEIEKFNEFFTGGLGSFTNIQTDASNWFATSSLFCDDGDCAQSNGISGNGNIIMEANISTDNANSTRFNFVYSLVNIIGADSFTITANNNVGSGDVVLFTDNTASVITSSQSISMPSSMWDQPLVTIQVECDATQSTRACYVDTISVNGTAIATTLTNVSSFNSVIKFGDGTLAADGFPERGIIYNASGDTIIIRGNATFDNIIEQDLNITNSLTIAGETITNWDNVSGFDDNVFLKDGSRAMTGNLTLTQKITFSLGEIIDNIIDGWIRVTGNLNVTGNLTANNLGIGTSDFSLQAGSSSNLVKINGSNNPGVLLENSNTNNQWLAYVQNSGGSLSFFDVSNVKIPFTINENVPTNSLVLTPTQIDVGLELDMNTKKIVNLVDPTANQDASTKNYTDANDHWDRTGTVLSPKTDGDDIVTTGALGVGVSSVVSNMNLILPNNAINPFTLFDVDTAGIRVGIYNNPSENKSRASDAISGINVIGSPNYTTSSTVSALVFGNVALAVRFAGLGDAGSSDLDAFGIKVTGMTGTTDFIPPFDGEATVKDVTGLDVSSANSATRVHGDIINTILRAATTTKVVDGNETMLLIEKPTKGVNNIQIDLEGTGPETGIRFGGSGGMRLYNDGTNFQFNQTGNGVWTFRNSTGLGTIRYGSALTSTQINNDTNVLESFKLGNELYNSDGSINHSAFGDCYEQRNETDFSRPVYIITQVEDKFTLPNGTDIYIPRIINETTHPYKILKSNIDLTCQQAELYQWGALMNRNMDLEENLTIFTSSTLAEHYVTNTTKDPATLTKVENFYNNLSNKTYQEMKDMVLTPEGKLSDNVLFNYEQSSMGSYNLEAIGHTNRAMNVLMLWKIANLQAEQDARDECWDLPTQTEIVNCMRNI